MAKLPSKNSVLSKLRNSEETEDQNLLEETLKLIEELFSLRLIDRIARPRDKLAKQVELNQFGAKLDCLHQKMSRIRSEIIEANLSDNLNTRGKSMFGSMTNKTVVDWKKYIRIIETRYNQVFMEGNFKNCRRICELLGLKFIASLELILIEDWAHECLESRRNDNCC